MKTNIYMLLLLPFVCRASGAPVPTGPAFAGSPHTAHAEKAGPGKNELNVFAFTQNKGQIRGYDGLPHPEVKFSLQQNNITLFLLESGMAYQFTRVHDPQAHTGLSGACSRGSATRPAELQGEIRTEVFRMDMTLIGADDHCRVSAAEEAGGYTNFHNRQVSGVRSYQVITYHDIYPGIDWLIYTKGDGVKYDFVVRPGADPSLIRMKFTHQEALQLNENGSFTLSNRLGSITELRPYSFQDSSYIGSCFSLENNIISFKIAAYDPAKTLVIDPALLWATYYGGTLIEYGQACATDAAGNVYLAGESNSNSNLIAQGGYQNTFGGGVDAFLAKFNSSGTRLWGTYFGGSGNDYGISCATDAAGNVFLAGFTTSGSGIASGGYQNTYAGGSSDAFLAKFSSSGTLSWSTYYGGPAADAGQSCSTDAAGNVFLAGYTTSSAGIASGGHQNTIGGANDAFLVKFNSSGIRQWATYLGGSNHDYAISSTTDASDNIFLAGQTLSSAGIAAGGHQNSFGGISDAFLTKFNSAGIRQWSTYYGGSADDIGTGCAADGSGNIYLSGYSNSSSGIAAGGHQTTGGGSYDGFLAKFNSAGSRQWATYYGGSGYDEGRACATDLAANVYLTGITGSTAGIATGVLQSTWGGGTTDAFLVKFNTAGTRQWASYFGGNSDDLGLSCATGPSGHVHLAGLTQSSAGISYNGQQSAYSGGGDAFLATICNEPGQPNAIIGNTAVCVNDNILYSVNAVPVAGSYSWTYSGSWTGSSATTSISVIPAGSGLISVSAQNDCGAGPAQTLSVTADLCLGTIQHAAGLQHPALYPNPGTGEFFIESDTAYDLVLRDACGSILLQQATVPGKNTLLLQSQPEGIYFLELRAGETSWHYKLIKSSR